MSSTGGRALPSPGEHGPFHARRPHRLALHGLGQTLYIVEGIALIQSRGGDILEAHPGDVIHTPAGEEHWHGAAPEQFMSHIALWEGDDVNWLEHVTDADYGGKRVSTRTRP